METKDQKVKKEIEANKEFLGLKAKKVTIVIVQKPQLVSIY